MEQERPARRKRNASLKALLNVPEPPKRKKPKKKKQTDEFETIWICSECKEAECSMDANSHFVICDGHCKRIFHYPCAGLSELPTETQEFVCEDCQKDSHACCICSNYGTDNIDVFKCCKSNCGLFFHESCLNMRNIAYQQVELQVDTTSTTTTSTMIPKFVCPAHACWTCTETEIQQQQDQLDTEQPKRKKKGRTKKKKEQNRVFESKPDAFLTRCMECPSAYHYHVSCIPPTARFHELATLCHEHSGNSKLPDLNLQDSLQEGQVEAAIDQQFSVAETKLRKQAAYQWDLFETFPPFTFPLRAVKQSKQIAFCSDDSKTLDSLEVAIDTAAFLFSLKMAPHARSSECAVKIREFLARQSSSRFISRHCPKIFQQDLLLLRSFVQFRSIEDDSRPLASADINSCKKRKRRDIDLAWIRRMTGLCPSVIAIIAG